VRATSERYDLVVSDNFHPARSGSGSLYTVEHFAAVRERLAPGRPVLPMAATAPSSTSRPAQHRADLRHGVSGRLAMLATNSLDTARRGPGRAEGRKPLRSPFDAQPAGVRHRRRSRAIRQLLRGPSSLARFAAMRRSYDDRPVVAYSAPRITYAPDSLRATG